MAGHTRLIRPETTVEDVLVMYPVAAGAFVRRRMHCVGCSMARFETVAEVCQIYREPLEAMLDDLNTAALVGGADSWEQTDPR